MILSLLPIGATSGWGVCGLNLALRLTRALPDFRIRWMELKSDTALDPLYVEALRPYAVDGTEHTWDTVLCPLGGNSFEYDLSIPHRRKVAYTFFVNNLHSSADIDQARVWDHILCGAEWEARYLSARGIDAGHLSVATQGIDQSVFRPAPSPRLFPSHFTIFSGGKFEYRKGQDIVIEVFRRFHIHHPDSLLVTSWYNPYAWSISTMYASPHVKAPLDEAEITGWPWPLRLTRFLAAHGIPPAAHLPLGLRVHHLNVPIYHACDVGLFPNRCEGGTNLVLMEAMASGLPCIATACPGHDDLLPCDMAVTSPVLPVRDVVENGAVTARWPEPDIDSLLDTLEGFYACRRAASDFTPADALDWGSTYSWDKTAVSVTEALQ